MATHRSYQKRHWLSRWLDAVLLLKDKRCCVVAALSANPHRCASVTMQAGIAGRTPALQLGVVPKVPDEAHAVQSATIPHATRRCSLQSRYARKGTSRLAECSP